MGIRSYKKVVCLIVVLVFATRVNAARPKDLGELYDLAQQSCVEVLINGHQSGTGCIVSSDGLVLTAAHVINQQQRIEVVSRGIGRRNAKVVAVNLGHDIALLQADSEDGDFKPLVVNRRFPAPGTDIYLFASPLYRHGILQRGMVARRQTTFEYQDRFIEVFHVAGQVQKGSSGGVWLNERGEIIGVQSGSVTSQFGPAGIANVTPARAVADLLATQQHASTPTLQMFVDELVVLSPEVLEKLPERTIGVVVQKMESRGAAEQSGVNQGDVITHINGKRIRIRDDYVGAIRTMKPGDMVTLTLLRGDMTTAKEVAVPVAEMEATWRSPPDVQSIHTTREDAN